MVNPDEYEAAQIAILLHDIGHGPFSHCLEGKIIPLHHEEISLLVIEQLNDEFKGRLSLAIEIFTQKYHKTFLSQLVSSQLDMDRMDYLNRDSFYTGVAEGVIGYDRLIKMMDVVDHQLVLEEKSLYSIEKFLMARKIMYWQVYQHKTSIVAEYLLKEFIDTLRKEDTELNYLRLNLQILLEKFDNVPLTDYKFSLFDKYLEVDDIEVMILLKKALTSSNERLRFLSKSLLHRTFPKIIIRNTPFDEDLSHNLSLQSKHLLGDHTMDEYTILSSGEADLSVYDSTSQEINIKTKDHLLIPLSELLNLQEFSARDRKYYLIISKNII
jgi:HD superfamily phosphohydrolase